MGVSFVEDELLKRSSTGILTPMRSGDIIQSSQLAMTTASNPALNASCTTVIIDEFGGVIISLTSGGNAQTLQSPTSATAGKSFTVVSDDGNGSHTIEVNGITLSASEAQRFIWDGSAWITVTAVDADDITLTPTGDIVATNVQDGIAELDTEKESTSTSHAARHVTGGGDTIADVVAAGNSGLSSGADKTKLDGIEAGADITDATNVNAAGAVMESDIKDQSFTNLLENGDFESWSAGDASAPDGWELHGTGAGVAKSATHKIGDASVALTYGSAICYIRQTLDEATHYQGRVLTVGCWMKCAAADQGRAQIGDSAGYSYGSYHTGGGDWEFVTCSRTIDAGATMVRTDLRFTIAPVGYIDGAILVEGSVCPAFSPKPLPDVGVGVAEFVEDPSTQSFTNLLENGDFESWSAGTSAAPDGWIASYSNISRESTIVKFGTHSCKVESAAGWAGMRVDLPGHERYRSRTMTAGAWVYVPTANTTDFTRIELKCSHTGDSTEIQKMDSWQWVTVTYTISAGATHIYLGFYPLYDATPVVGEIMYVDGAILVEGSVCPAFSPKPLVDDGQSIVIDSTTNQVTIDGTVMNAVEAGADVTDATNVNAAGAVMESDIKDQSFTNLLGNGDFESWSGGPTAAPDGYNIGNATIEKAAWHKVGTNSVKLTATSVAGRIYRTTAEYERYQGKYVTFAVWCYSSGANAARLKIVDGVGSSNSSYHSGSGAWELLTITRLIDASATKVECYMYADETSGSRDSYFDAAILVEGSVCPAFSPKPLADDGQTLAIDSTTNKVTLGNILVCDPVADTSITAAGGITVVNTIMRVYGTAGIDITADPQITAGTDGQIVIIQGTHDTNTVKLDNGTGLALSASITLAANDNIMLMYDSGGSVWIEMSRTTVA